MPEVDYSRQSYYPYLRLFVVIVLGCRNLNLLFCILMYKSLIYKEIFFTKKVGSNIAIGVPAFSFCD